jgi:hypothetical protein
VAETVYILCALTSAACAILLLRGYARSRSRLLLWSSACFFGLCANNILLFVDLILLPQIDLVLLRSGSALLSLLILLYGLVWESQ